jgi:hypothetical protein
MIKSLISDGQLYTATVADFSGTDPLIYREPLRTERSDLKQLNGNYLCLKTHLSYPVSIFMKLTLSDVQGIMGSALIKNLCPVIRHFKNSHM